VQAGHLLPRLVCRGVAVCPGPDVAAPLASHVYIYITVLLQCSQLSGNAPATSSAPLE
jgi:hypothetical protein